MTHLPNHIALHNGVMLGIRFGGITRMTPVQGLHPHVAVRFEGGLLAELDAATLAQLARQAPAALAAFPAFGECSGALADLDEVEP